MYLYASVLSSCINRNRCHFLLQEILVQLFSCSSAEIYLDSAHSFPAQGLAQELCSHLSKVNWALVLSPGNTLHFCCAPWSCIVYSVNMTVTIVNLQNSLCLGQGSFLGAGTRCMPLYFYHYPHCNTSDFALQMTEVHDSHARPCYFMLAAVYGLHSWDMYHAGPPVPCSVTKHTLGPGGSSCTKPHG